MYLCSSPVYLQKSKGSEHKLIVYATLGIDYPWNILGSAIGKFGWAKLLLSFEILNNDQ